MINSPRRLTGSTILLAALDFSTDLSAFLKLMSKKNKINLVIAVLLLAAIPAIIYLVKHPQIFKGRALGPVIAFFGSNIIREPNGSQAFTLDSQGRATVNVRLNSPFGPAGAGGSGNTATNQSGGGSANSGVTLSLSPGSGNETNGTPFDVTVNLNAGTNDIVFVDVNINFDKNLLTMSSFTPSGNFDLPEINGPPDNTGGTFRLAMSRSSPNQLTGNINLGTAHFIGKATGTATVTVSSREITVGGANPVDIQVPAGSGSYKIQ